VNPALIRAVHAVAATEDFKNSRRELTYASSKPSGTDS
jgi:hypothetical protein